jgi:hypothetical protein
MKNIFVAILLLCSPFAAWATPQDDALFVAQREYEVSLKETIETALRSYFVPVYFRPLEGQGVKIADRSAFADLVPDDVIAPYRDHWLKQTSDQYLSILGPERISTIAEILRLDEEMTLNRLLKAEEDKRFATALADARAQTETTASDNPNQSAVEELTVQLRAFNAAMDDGGSEAFAESFAVGMASIIALGAYSRAIYKIEKPLNNPVTRAAIETRGVLSFANPVQRQALLREIAASEKAPGIRFRKPPKNY